MKRTLFLNLCLSLLFLVSVGAQAATAEPCEKTLGELPALDLTSLGFYRVATKSPEIAIANPMENARRHLVAIKEAQNEGAHVILFPEMSLTGYTVEDIVQNSSLLLQTRKALAWLAEETKAIPVTIIVGAPYQYRNGLYNTAFVLHGGKIQGAVPKSHLPNYKEFYDLRWYASGKNTDLQVNDSLLGRFRLSRRQLFTLGEMVFGVEICEDAFADIPLSVYHARAGANVVFNLSASNELVGKAQYRKNLVDQRSSDFNLAYVYASSGPSESTKDLLFSGHNLISENGSTIGELRPLDPSRNDSTPGKPFEGKLLVKDLDIQKIKFKRAQNRTNADAPMPKGYTDVVLEETARPLKYDLARHVDPTPFLPHDPAEMKARSQEIIHWQAMGLARTLTTAHAKTMIIGVSGGSDSTLALLVCVEAAKILGWGPEQIIAITMPSFGTSDETYELALEMMRQLGVTLCDIPISDTVLSHFKDIEHDPENEDVVFENAQARYRTMILFQMANKLNGIVVGTGDLSENWLGFMTLVADHQAGWNPNSSIPKTLVKYLIKAYADNKATPAVSEILHKVFNLTISPELTRPKDGKIQQSSEAILGPYVVHDFFLYNLLANGMGPLKLYELSKVAFKDVYSPGDLKRWLNVFFTRGFANQHKRNTNPAGLMIGLSLSQRGSWRMPSEADWRGFLAELDGL